MSSETMKLPVREKVGYGIGEIASNIIWMTIMFFLPIFYTDTFGIPAAVVGTMFFVVRLFDAINDPIMGMIADRTNTRWGKYRPYILWMAVPYGIGGILMFMTPDFSLTFKIIYAYTTYIFMMIIYTASMIPYSALSGVMTSDYLERTSLNSYRFVGAFVGGLFIQGLALYMVSQLGIDNQSLITASIKNNQVVVQEVGTGTVRITITAEDSLGETVQDDFLFKINLPGENPPEVERAIPDMWLHEGFGEKQIAVLDVFADPDNDPLEYEVKSSMNDIVKPEMDGSTLVIKEQGIGSARVTLFADDGNGGIVTNTFAVHVQKLHNNPPQLLAELPDLSFEEEIETDNFDLARTFGLFPTEELDISNIFNDPDNDELFYTVSSDNPAVVAALITDSHLILKKKMPGTAVITVSADDNKGAITSTRFAVTIVTPGNMPPVVTHTIDDVIIQSGFGEYTIDIGDVFADRDGDPVSYQLKVNNNAKGYRLTMSIFAVLCIFLFLITFVSTKERIKPVSEKQSALKDDLKDLLRNRPWIILFIVSLITLIYVAVRSAVIAYYFRYYVGDPGLTAAFLVSGSVTIIISLTITKWLTKIFDKRLLYVICMIAVGGSISLYTFAKPEDIIFMFVLQIVQSFFSGPTMPLLWSMLADSADYSEWKTGRKAMGLTYSASTFAQKAGIALGGAIALWLLSFYGYQPNVEQSAESLFGMKMMMGIYPAIGAFACAIIISFYNLNQNKMEKIQAEMNARKENK